jgi:hypothetical protein
MTPRFSVHALQVRAGEILSSDPHNAGRRHNIRKLEAVKAGDGQFRLTMGRWRFRYDIFGRQVWLL